jgi:hypothetical protein
MELGEGSMERDPWRILRRHLGDNKTLEKVRQW